jgi:cell wall-associated NlpC family hydrolase
VHTSQANLAVSTTRGNDSGGLGVIKRSVLAMAVIIVATFAPLPAAQAATAPPRGNLWTATQDTFEHRLHVTGWAQDPASPVTAVTVTFWVDGHYLGHAPANRPSSYLNTTYGFPGDHRFDATFSWVPTAGQVTARTTGAVSTAPSIILATAAATHFYPGPSARLMSVAKRYVGYPYVEGGASPSGFDCSGYSQYVYYHAQVRTLPHNAESQRLSTGMRLISRSEARPGDLVFYMSGGYAYHLAIYAGNGMQYAAATVRDGVRYQAVWSSSVQYRTDWH